MAFSNAILPNFAPYPQGGRALAGLQQIYDAQTNQAQSQYAPQQAYANALLTTQQAQWLPYQYQMQAISNPMLWMAAQNNPELQQTLTKMISNPMQPNVSGIAANINPPGQSNGLIGSLISPLINKLTGQSSNQNSLLGNSNNNLSQQTPQNTASSVNNNGQLLSTPNATPSGSYAGGQYSQMVASPEQAKAQATANISAWSDENKRTQAQFDAANELKNQMIAFHNIFTNKDTSMTGPLLGQVNPYSPLAGVLNAAHLANVGPSQSLQDLANNMVLNLGSSGKFGRLAGPELSFISGVKPNIKMTPESEQNAYNRITSTADRSMERQPFNLALQAPPLNASTAETDVLYNSYNKALPPYDKNINPNPNGLWHYFTTPQALNAIRSGQTNYVPENWDQIVKQAKSGNNDQAVAAPPPVSMNQNITPSMPSAGAKSLASNMQLPAFQSKEQFQQWYSQQPTVVQQAVRLHMGGQ